MNSVGFDYIYQKIKTTYGGQSAILNQTTSAKRHMVLFRGTNAQNLKSISQSSTDLWPKIGFDHIWQSVGHLELDNLEKTTQVFIFRCLI